MVHAEAWDRGLVETAVGVEHLGTCIALSDQTKPAPDIQEF